MFYPQEQEYVVANGEDDLSPMPTIFEVDKEKPAATVVKFDQNGVPDGDGLDGPSDWNERQKAAIARQQELLNNIKKH